MTASGIYTLLTSQTGWLNTSRPLKAEELQGRIILLDFWTFCCINCMHVIPDLHYLEEKFGDKLTVIGVHSAKFKHERDSENIRAAMLRYDIEHPVVNDFDFTIWNGFGTRSWPTFVLIDANGRIAAHYSGEGHREELERDIAALIQRAGNTLVTAPLPLALEKNKEAPTVLKFPGKLAYGEVDGTPTLFISDSGRNRIVLADKDGAIREVIGDGAEGLRDGSFAQARFNKPQGMAYLNGMLYIADTDNHALRAADMKTRTVTTLAGTGEQGYERAVFGAPARAAKLASPWDVAFYPDNAHLAIAMAGTHQLWSYSLSDKTVTVLAGNGRESIDDGVYPLNSLSQPSGLSVVNGKLYFVDSETSSLRVLEKARITTLIGTGLFDFGYKEGKQGTALMQHALGLWADKDNIYIADSYNHALRRYDVAAATLHDYAGNGERGAANGTLKEARFNEPNDILRVGDVLYVADTNNHAIRRVDMKTGAVATLNVREAAESSYTYSEALPNVVRLPQAQVKAGAASAIRFGLKPGWKINHEAPSYLAVFDAKKQFVAALELAQLTSAAPQLPPLKSGDYTLQGTLYYCEDAASASECLIGSVELPLTAGEKGDAINIPLNK